MWSATWDEESKAVYYWNSETDETTWERPEGVEISGEDSLPGQSHSQRDDGPDDGEAAPGTAGDNADEAQRLRDYYNSKEYAEWYYAAYGGPKASGDAATGATTTAKSLHGHQFAGAWNPMTAAGDGEALDSAWQNGW
ncbi:hypothetical protein BC830DRAFT_1129523 [Chytriomyces sp. MP71]|nr:hypothetical protein BC830DRAFT_1129523 [Chytriomyces sp. MP71]